MTYQEVIQRTKQNDSNVVALYAYGSRVYGNFHKKSDYDFIMIVKERQNEQFSDTLINVNYFTIEAHQHRLNEHEISALECYFLSPEHILIERQKFVFKLNLQKLRKALAGKSSHSWVKAKKKLTVPQDYDLDLGRKSMFHAYRIIEYGIQIAQNDKIVNYASCNELYKEIIQYYDWQSLYDCFKQRYNKICTEFRNVAPK